MNRRCSVTCATAVLAVLAACGDAPTRPAETAGRATPASGVTYSAPPAHPPVSGVQATAASDEWRCGGDLAPPTGYQQETAFEDAHDANARERAVESATRRLTERLCGNASSADCEALAASARPWKTGRNDANECAMVVVKDADWRDWQHRTMTLQELDAKLAQAAGELLPGPAVERRVAIDRVRDLGVPGGARADWLRERLERFLQDHGTLADVPKGWAGDGLPARIDVVVRCDIVARAEQGVATLEANCVALRSGRRRTRSSPVTFAEHAAPPGPSGTAPATLPESAGITVRLDSRRGGSLCAGDRTQIWLRSQETTYVRVFDLYGDGEALLIFPNREQRASLARAGQSIALGGELGFEAVPVPGSDEERFLVVAASDESTLGRLRDGSGPCRVPPELA